MANMKLFLTIAALACLLAADTTTVLTMQPNPGRSRPVPQHRLLIGAPMKAKAAVVIVQPPPTVAGGRGSPNC
jgi:hypothetical protein